MTAVVLALASSAVFGVADFLGGVSSRRAAAIAVAVWSQAAGATALLVVVLAGGAAFAGEGFVWGMAAGVFGGSGVLAFYRGLAVGTMSIVAPIAATGAVLPVVVDLAGGDVPTTLVALGLVAAMTGAAMAGLAPETSASHAGAEAPPTHADPGHSHALQALLFAVAAAVGFGLFFLFLGVGADRTPDDAALWVVAGARAGSLPTLLAFATVLGRGGAMRLDGPRVIGLVVLCGLLDTTANCLFTVATTEDVALGVVAVLGSLYPVSTVLLARAVLKERLSVPQGIGVGVALLGVVLISAG